jgi:maleate isomerase
MPSPQRIRIGILVPSSNTALEPLTTSILASLPHVTAHFSRFPVTTIGLTPTALSQFDPHKLVEAAQLLAHANVDIIGWSGTSSGWLGFAADDELCRLITEATGIPATTSILGLNKAIRILGVKRLGLVTPYLDDVQQAIIKNYKGIGVDAGAERHLGRTDNVRFAELGAETFDPMVDGVVKEGVDAVTVFCTNLAAAQYVERWEREYDVVVLDSVATVVWDALRMCDVDTSQIQGWGKLMDLNSTA